MSRPNNEGLVDFLHVFESHFDAIARDIAADSAAFVPGRFDALVASRRDAIRHARAGNWTPIDEQARAQARALGKQGVGLAALVRLNTLAIRAVTAAVVTTFASDPARLTAALVAGQDLADRMLSVLLEETTLAQKAMQATDTQFRALLESAPDAMVILGKNGLIQLVNAQTEALFGYPRAELVGQPIEILVPERFRSRHAGHRLGYFDGPRPRQMGAGLDLFGLRKDGTEFAAEISLSPIATPEGTLVSAAIRDVTERKRDLEQQNRRMQEANRLKSEFLANMSHELRTPLNAIIGFTTLLHTGKTGPLSATQVEYLGDILTSSKHLLQLINDVLDLAKIESGRTEISVEQVELGRLAHEVRDILRGLAGEKRLKLSIEVDPSLGPVHIDPRLMKQVLYNYLSNAIKFTAEGGTVWLRIAAHGDDGFRVDVGDSGIGIKAEDMGKLFVEFQQLDAGSTKRYQGTGLGLAVTRRIVEAQGGTVAVESTFGKGSVFSALMPRTVKDTR